ncbi:MAG: phosphatidate cytidylyltransferase [Pirellulaceae bacterium]
MLRWRLLGAAGILVPLFGLLYLDTFWNFGVPGLWLVPIGGLLVVAAAGETLDILHGNGYRPADWAVYGGAMLVFLTGCGPTFVGLLNGDQGEAFTAAWEWSLMAMGAALVLAFLSEMTRFREPGRSIVHVALAWLVVGYAGLLMSFVARLRFFRDEMWGMVALISLVLVVKMSDTGAYTVGKLCGKRKMSPRLSPGKTVEGAIGGLVFAAGASWLFFGAAVPWAMGVRVTPWWGPPMYGLIVALAGMVGDLAESLLKRDMGRKDSSRWLPGLGGVLDVVDSVLMAAPAALCCWSCGLVAPG